MVVKERQGFLLEINRLVQEGKDGAARDLLEEYLDVRQDDADAWALLGRLYLLNKQASRAAEALRKSLDLRRLPVGPAVHTPSTNDVDLDDDDLAYIDNVGQGFSHLRDIVEDEIAELPAESPAKPKTLSLSKDQSTLNDATGSGTPPASLVPVVWVKGGKLPSRILRPDEEQSGVKAEITAETTQALSDPSSTDTVGSRCASTSNPDNVQAPLEEVSQGWESSDTAHAGTADEFWDDEAEISEFDEPVEIAVSHDPVFDAGESAFDFSDDDDPLGSDVAHDDPVFDGGESAYELLDDDEVDELDAEYSGEELDALFDGSTDISTEADFSSDDLLDLVGVDFEDLAETEGAEPFEEPETYQGLTRHQRAMQLAAEFLVKTGWDKRWVKMVAAILEASGNTSATTRALLNEVDKGLIPQELILACRVREIWAGSRHFWMAFDRRHHQAEERYWNCSWVIAVQIVRTFHGLPDVDEISYFLEREFQRWYTNNPIRQRTRSFMRYLLARLVDCRKLGIDPLYADFEDWSTVRDYQDTPFRDRMGWQTIDAFDRLANMGVDLPKEPKDHSYGGVDLELVRDALPSKPTSNSPRKPRVEKNVLERLSGAEREQEFEADSAPDALVVTGRPVPQAVEQYFREQLLMRRYKGEYGRSSDASTKRTGTEE